MKNLAKIAILGSLLVITSLLIGACGTEGAARNEGSVAITVIGGSSTSGAALAGVLVEVRETAGTGAFSTVGTTPATGKLTFTGTAGTDYYFQFSKTGYTTQTDLKRSPLLTSTVTLDVTLLTLLGT